MTDKENMDTSNRDKETAKLQMAAGGQVGDDLVSNEERILVLKIEKAKARAAFTRQLNKVYGLIDEEITHREDVNVQELRHDMDYLIEAEEKAVDIIEILSIEYSINADIEARKVVLVEIDKIVNDCAYVLTKLQQYIEVGK